MKGTCKDYGPHQPSITPTHNHHHRGVRGTDDNAGGRGVVLPSVLKRLKTSTFNFSGSEALPLGAKLSIISSKETFSTPFSWMNSTHSFFSSLKDWQQHIWTSLKNTYVTYVYIDTCQILLMSVNEKRLEKCTPLASQTHSAEQWCTLSTSLSPLSLGASCRACSAP